MEVTNCNWATLDGWWESYVGPDQSVLTDGDTPILDTRWPDGQWASIGDWWTSYVTTDRSALVDDSVTTLDNGSLTDGWSDLDEWWRAYSEARQEDVEELLVALDRADKTWAAGQGPFDTDPLSADWRTARGSTGPIRITREEDWSYGLADLFRSGSGVLIGELFDDLCAGTPDSVETEAHLPGGSETTRYEDILINTQGGGVSIEVKIGDTNLQKTVETATLVERHYTGDWTQCSCCRPISAHNFETHSVRQLPNPQRARRSSRRRHSTVERSRYK